MPHKPLRIAVIGGAGHVGLPLSLLLAKQGFTVTVIDIDKKKIKMLRRRQFPFMEEGGPELFRQIKPSQIIFTTRHNTIKDNDVIFLTIGTPVDLHLNPDLVPVYKSIQEIKPYLRNEQVLILRSTLFPGTTERIHTMLEKTGLQVGVSFCPERIAQNVALRELKEFPQIISASDPRTLAIVKRIFLTFAPETVELSLTEAELVKLFTNAWRYIRFAVANQFYMLTIEKGFDFYKIRDAMTHNYKRAADFPLAGFAAGPCLFKDTMQLAAYTRHSFTLGNAAMLLNETLPDFLVEQVKQRHALAGKRVGILGMAFKADSDDLRESLAYKLRKLLILENATVMCTDPYISDPTFYPVEDVMGCEIVFIGCPHAVYKRLKFDGHKTVDCWGFTHRCSN